MDKKFMSLALEEAKKAAEIGEVPIGAVIVRHGEAIASAHNLREALSDATAHAEVLAIREACKSLGGWHLTDCTLYVTLEPCPMCAGAVINSCIDRVVFGANDHRDGSMGSVANLPSLPYSRRPATEGGIMEKECKALLSDFFKKLRGK